MTLQFHGLCGAQLVSWWLTHLEHRIIQWTRQPDLTTIKLCVFPDLERWSACTRKFFTHMAMIFNPNKLQFFTDNFNSSTGGSDIGEDTNIHHNDSHF